MTTNTTEIVGKIYHKEYGANWPSPHLIMVNEIQQGLRISNMSIDLGAAYGVIGVNEYTCASMAKRFEIASRCGDKPQAFDSGAGRLLIWGQNVVQPDGSQTFEVSLTTALAVELPRIFISRRDAGEIAKILKRYVTQEDDVMNRAARLVRGFAVQ
ncbi:MAG: hypothetical protein HOY44_03475 [Maritimibacter sp.]|uniref:hypothetical protein n=1 Tax=Maritimibacter sp. TaxID=2003363 RepID=UPI001D30C096|nr:hypothetical protein [Maritimibacter sp.]MBL6426572.1 hypothetical protein [Maritimibacter sp.]